MSAPEVGCFHCGLPIAAAGAVRVRVGDVEHVVCCRGCEAAALVIDAAGLLDYYRWRTQSGPRPVVAEDDPWSAYDRPETLQALERNGPLTVVNLLFEGVRCSACGWLIEHRLAQLLGVASVGLNPATARARVAFDAIPLSTILRTIATLGYRPHVLGRTDTLEVALHERRAAIKRLGVAGLGMMQVMMIAVAFYAGDHAGMTPVIRNYLRLISLLITVPVALYAGIPFYTGAWRVLSAGRLSMDVPVTLAVLLAFVASAINTLRGSGEVYFDSVTMFLFLLLLGRYLEMLARHRAGSTAEALVRMLPAVANRVTPAGDQQVPVSTLAVGDTVRIAVGDAFPADGTLAANDTLADESLITGEPEPVLKRAGDRVVAGTVNLLRPALVTLTALGTSTVLAGIVHLLERASTDRAARARLADRVAARFVACVLVGAVVTAIVWLTIDPARAFAATLAVLVATCPCALSLATPVAVTAAMGALARRGVLVTRADALEALANVNHAVLDKTGTLTVGRPQIVAVETSAPVNPSECTAIAAGLERASGHPLARAFETENPRPALDIRVTAGAGVEGIVDGSRYRIGHAAFVAECAGPRPVPLAEDGIHLGRPGEWLARFAVEDRPRPGVRAALGTLCDAGLTLEIASGDHAAAVAATAAAAGVATFAARQTPADKLARVRALQGAGARVMVIGDGINDAPCLGAADVSVAMASGSALAQATADLIVLGGDLAVVGTALALARRTRAIIRQNLLWAAGYNLVSLPLAACGLVPPWLAAVGMSLSSVLVVANSLRLARTTAPPARPAAATGQRHAIEALS
jgi:Cu2+-exporting ATPase